MSSKYGEKELTRFLKRRKFIYKQIDIGIDYERFERILNAFQSNKYSAKHHYGPELKKEIRRIVKETTAKL
jgi:hypothetical protein